MSAAEIKCALRELLVSAVPAMQRLSYAGEMKAHYLLLMDWNRARAALGLKVKRWDVTHWATWRDDFRMGMRLTNGLNVIKVCGNRFDGEMIVCYEGRQGSSWAISRFDLEWWAVMR